MPIDDVDDAVSEVMILALEQLPRHAAQIRALSPWLTTLATNVCIDLYRRRDRLGQPHESRTQDWLDLEGASPEAHVDALEQANRLVELSSQLSPLLSNALFLRSRDDLSYEEISDRLQISVSAARKRVQRARRALRKMQSDSMTLPATSRTRTRQIGIGEVPEISSSPGLPRHVIVSTEAGWDLDLFISVPKPASKPDIRLRTLNEYERAHPHGWKMLEKRADLLYEQGRWKEAVRDYRRVIERHRSINTILRLAHILSHIDSRQQAVEILEQGARWARRASTQHHLSGLMFWNHGREVDAIRELQRAWALEPDNPVHGEQLGEFCFDLGRFREAIRAFDRVLQSNPKNVWVLARSCQALTGLGLTRAVPHRIDTATRLDPACLPALKFQVDQRCWSRKVFGQEGTSARRAIRRMLSLAGASADVHESLANYHIQRADWNRGRSVLEEFADTHPRNGLGLWHLAKWLHFTGESDRAVDAIRRLESLGPTDLHSLMRTAEILIAGGKKREAHLVGTQLVIQYADRWIAWATAARTRVGLDSAQAVSFSAKTIRLQADSGRVWMLHATILTKAGAYRDASRALVTAWDLLHEGGSSELLVEIALRMSDCYEILGDLAKQDRWLMEARSQAVALRSTNPPLGLYYRARTLELLGDRSRAVAGYKAAIRSNLLYPLRFRAIARTRHPRR